MNFPYHKTLQVDHSNGYTNGHFEGHAIVPGAVSLKWMLEVLTDALGIPELGTYEVRNLKCLQELPPPCEVQITIEQKSDVLYRMKLEHAGEVIVVADTSLSAPTQS